MSRPPSAFLSYCRENKRHKAWVLALATRLRADGVETVLDQWHAIPGDQLPQFMEAAVRDNDFVLVVCTPTYKRRSDARQGGVGYEGDVMTAQALTGQSQRKFIPILRTGAWLDAAPSWMAGKYFLDLSANPYSEVVYEQLLMTLRNEHPAAPMVGSRGNERFRRIYYTGFDSQHLKPQEIREKFGDLWLIGKKGAWEGKISGGVYALSNTTGADAELHNRFRYSEVGDTPVNLADCKVSARVKVEGPNDAHSGGGILFRINEEGGDYYAFFLNAGNTVSFAVTRIHVLKFLWSQEIRHKERDAFTTLQIVGNGPRLDLFVDNVCVHTVMDAVLLDGNPGSITLSIGQYSFDDYAIYHRIAE